MNKRKIICLLMCTVFIILITGCKESGNTSDSTPDNAGIAENRIDVDLTVLSSTMVYSEVYNMMCYPDDYPKEGESICITGTFETYKEGNNTYCTLRNAQIKHA